MRENKKLPLLAAGAFLLLLCCALAAWYFLAPRVQQGDKQITVTVDHLAWEDKTLTITTDEEHLLDAVIPHIVVTWEDGPYGAWLFSVDQETADESKEQWWGFTINGEIGQYAADHQPIYDGDEVVFTLHEGWI